MVVLCTLACVGLDDQPGAVGGQGVPDVAGRADGVTHVVQGVEDGDQVVAGAGEVGGRGDLEADAVADTGVPTVAVAMRTPWDVAGYPAGVAAVCTYSVLPESLEALARALAGEIGFPGGLPVAIPGLEASTTRVALGAR